MANCNVTGPLPDWLGGLSELRQLDLQRNNLRGSIPPQYGNLVNLLYFNLKDNPELNGTIPVEQLARLTRLNRLSLVHCRFEGAEQAVEELQRRIPRCRVWI
jgi:Leucine-rich repeat (LRR) protein